MEANKGIGEFQTEEYNNLNKLLLVQRQSQQSQELELEILNNFQKLWEIIANPEQLKNLNVVEEIKKQFPDLEKSQDYDKKRNQNYIANSELRRKLDEQEIKIQEQQNLISSQIITIQNHNWYIQEQQKINQTHQQEVSEISQKSQNQQDFSQSVDRPKDIHNKSDQISCDCKNPTIIDVKEKPISLLLGQSSQGKQMIMNNLFKKAYQQDLDIFVIDTEPFEFEDIDIRENQINQYKKIFKENPNKFIALWIAVKFERTDIMKKSIMDIYKHVHKLKIPISIIVTDFHLSENEERDKEELRKKLKLYKPNQIVFVGQNTSYDSWISQLSTTLPENKRDQSYPMELQDTLFEDENEEEQQKMLLELTNALRY